MVDTSYTNSDNVSCILQVLKSMNVLSQMEIASISASISLEATDALATWGLVLTGIKETVLVRMGNHIQLFYNLPSIKCT